MGWTGTFLEGRDLVEYLTKQTLVENLHVIAHSRNFLETDCYGQKINIMFLAVYDSTDGSISAYIAKYAYYKEEDELCYDIIPETWAGKDYYSYCPHRILNLLTPTDDETANAWRDECRRPRWKKIAEKRYGKKSVDVLS